MTRRALWSVVAQVLSSASNSALQIGLMLTLSPAGFGAMVIGLSVWFLALFLGRAWVGDPLVALSGAAREGHGRRDLVDGAWPTARRRLLVTGMVASVAIGGWALWTPVSGVRPALFGLALGTPLLAVQDGYRYLFWAHHSPRRVVMIDGLWLGAAAGVVIGAVAVTGSATVSAGALLVGWVAGGVLSCGAAAALARRTTAGAAPMSSSAPTPASSRARTVGPVRPGSLRALSWSQIVLAVESNALPVVVAAGAGTVVTAGLRAALLPFLPMTTVTGALRMLALPELRAGAEEGRLRSAVIRVVATYGGVALVASAVGLALVHGVPSVWLGETGRSVLPWYGLAALVVSARAVNVGLADTLSLTATGSRVLGYRFGTSALDWAGALLGAAYAGVPGALVGRTLAGLASGGLWLVALSLVGRGRRSVSPTVGLALAPGRGVGERST